MMPDQHTFYLLSEVIISFIGSMILLAIWSAIRTYFKPKLSHEITVKRVDKGLLFFRLSVFVWGLSGLVTYFNNVTIGSNWLILVSQNTFSILNSMFLIFALFYLDNAPAYIYNNKKSTRRIIVFLFSLSILSFLLALNFGSILNDFGIQYSVIPDLILSSVLAWFLMVSLYRTFINRGMHIIAIIAVVSIVLLFLSQFSVVLLSDSYSFLFDLMKLIAKSTLISIFLVLGTSWVIELSQTPTVTDMKIYFTDWNQVIITIPSKGIINQTIEFGKKTTQFNNFLKLAIRRKYAPEKEMCIEIIAGGEISSQTYLSRIVENINSILQLDESYLLVRNDLFTFIGQGKYRLRFLPDHIEIDAALLVEFIQNIEDERYRKFVDLSTV